MLDYIIFAPWPRGLFLAKKLIESDKKIAYVEILPQLKSPFGLFLKNSFFEEKQFLQSLGFLLYQKGGFCILSPKGVWPLQDMQGICHSVLKNHFLNKNLSPEEGEHHHFKNHWLNYLSLNLASKVFEYNNSCWSNNKLNLFDDYFLFEPSLKKMELFKNNHPNISFYQAFVNDIGFDKAKGVYVIKNKPLKSKSCVWLGDSGPLFLNPKPAKPYWIWEAYFFEVNFNHYAEIIPPHFVCLKNLFLPWSHNNLLSVFHKAGQLEVWVRRPYTKANPDFKSEVLGTQLLSKPYKKTKEDFVKANRLGSLANKQADPDFVQALKEHLHLYFPHHSFLPINKKSFLSFKVYGQEALLNHSVKNGIYIETAQDFFQQDLAHALHSEKQLLNLSF